MLTLKLRIVCDSCNEDAGERDVLVHIDDENVMRIVNPDDVLPPGWKRLPYSGAYVCGSCKPRSKE